MCKVLRTLTDSHLLLAPTALRMFTLSQLLHRSLKLYTKPQLLDSGPLLLVVTAAGARCVHCQRIICWLIRLPLDRALLTFVFLFRQIRCSGFESSQDGRCSNCIRFNQECMFTPVSSQAQAFVPAHAAYPHLRNPQNQGRPGPPVMLYGAHGQPLPPQQQPQPPADTTLPPPQGMYQHPYGTAPPPLASAVPADHVSRKYLPYSLEA